MPPAGALLDCVADAAPTANVLRAFSVCVAPHVGHAGGGGAVVTLLTSFSNRAPHTGQSYS